MKELDFYTEEGKKEALEYFKEITQKEDKTELSQVLYSMMEFIASHELKFNDIKRVL